MKEKKRKEKKIKRSKSHTHMFSADCFRNVPSHSSHSPGLRLPVRAGFLHCGRDYSCQHASSLLSLVSASVNGLSEITIFSSSSELAACKVTSFGD